MTRWILLSLLALPALAACNQPTEEDCRKAIQNIDRISGRTTDPTEEAAAVRKCRGAASKKAVRCWMNAKTAADIEACEGPKRQAKKTEAEAQAKPEQQPAQQPATQPAQPAAAQPEQPAAAQPEQPAAAQPEQPAAQPEQNPAEQPEQKPAEQPEQK